MKKNLPFIPIILGTDINAYAMARSFHDAYGIKPILVGRMHLSYTKFSNIPKKIELFDELADKEAFPKILKEVANKYRQKNKDLVLVGTNDQYVRLIIEHQEVLREDYLFNYTSEDLLNQLLIKSNFYELCAKYGLDTPTTYFYDCNSSDVFNEEMAYPVIIKPSNGLDYYDHPFEGQKKVFRLDSLEAVQETVAKIKASGYRDKLIIQDYIPGDDTYMWDSVVYINSNKQTELVSLGQVVLQEHIDSAIGNYSAVMTRYNEPLMLKLNKFLTDIGYQGFANFDLKYDERDGKYKVFEVNVRQGRSSFYINECGHNMAEYIVDDLVYQRRKGLTLLRDNFLFTVVPKVVLKKFVKNKKVQKELRQLIRQKRFGKPLFNKKDKNLKRKLYLFLRQVNYYRKYKNNHW